jgi:excisionase family DNA binding protein
MDRRTTGYRLAYTVAELADACGLQVRHVRVLITRGEIPAFRMGRIWLVRRESFEAWAQMQERKRPAGRADVRGGDLGRANSHRGVDRSKTITRRQEGAMSALGAATPDQPAAVEMGVRS